MNVLISFPSYEAENVSLSDNHTVCVCVCEATVTFIPVNTLSRNSV